MNNKVFISCAVTGSGDTASKHPDLPKIEDAYKRAVTTIILENQEKSLREDRAFLSEAAPTNSSFGGNASMDSWDPILISLVRRAMPNLIAYDICGE